MTRLPSIALGAAIILGGAWYLTASTGGAPGVTSFEVNAQEADADAATADADAEAPVIADMVLGDPDAAVSVIEYASFTCPHCASFHAGPFQQLKADYIDTGKISFTYREVYFDRFGLWAGMIARCSGDTERYFGIADLIYEQQSEWTDGDPATIAQNLRRIGKTAGLNDGQLDACLNDAAKAQAMVARFEDTTAADDVNATPTFIIDGEKHANMSYADFSTLLDGKLEE